MAQGESTLFIVGLEGKEEPLFTALIDGGKAQYVVHILSTLKVYGITTLDAVVNTHYDADHIEGLTVLMQQKSVIINNVYARSREEDEEDDKRRGFHKQAQGKAKLISKNKDLVEDLVEPNKNLLILCKFSFKCIAINNGVGFDENNNSAAFLVKFGDFKYFTAGDLTTEQEDRLLGKLGNLTAFKCGHHGSKHSTSEDKFLANAKPKVSFISAGKHSYCHPDEAVLKRLHNKNIPAYLTNCCYNRHQINPNYIQSEKILIQKYLEILNGHIEESKTNSPVKQFKQGMEISIIEYEKEKNGTSFASLHTKLKEVLKSAEEKYTLLKEKDLGYFIDDLKKVTEAIDSFNKYTTLNIIAFVSGCNNYLGNIELYYRYHSDIFHVGYANSTITTGTIVEWKNYSVADGGIITDQLITTNPLVSRTVDGYQSPFSLPSLSTKEEKLALCNITIEKCEEPASYTCNVCIRRVCEKHASEDDKSMGIADIQNRCKVCNKELDEEVTEEEEENKKPMPTKFGRHQSECPECHNPVSTSDKTYKRGNNYYHPDCLVKYTHRKKSEQI